MTWLGRTLNSCLAMLAACGVQAGVCQAESLYWLSAENVRFKISSMSASVTCLYQTASG
jgi:hypothetical protein